VDNFSEQCSRKWIRPELEGPNIHSGRIISSFLPAEYLSQLSDLSNDEAKIVTYNGLRFAFYKDRAGLIHAVNPACTHIKCEVVWNPAEKSWDCPCHGSRFNYDGLVLKGPGSRNLEKIDHQKIVK
jgi:Rieske Fe-S protein